MFLNCWRRKRLCRTSFQSLGFCAVTDLLIKNVTSGRAPLPISASSVHLVSAWCLPSILIVVLVLLLLLLLCCVFVLLFHGFGVKDVASNVDTAKAVVTNLQGASERLCAFSTLGKGRRDNMERDFHVWMATGKSLGVEPYFLKVQLRVKHRIGLRQDGAVSNLPRSLSPITMHLQIPNSKHIMIVCYKVSLWLCVFDADDFTNKTHPQYKRQRHSTQHMQSNVHGKSATLV
jgi:hypothetical protein